MLSGYGAVNLQRAMKQTATATMDWSTQAGSGPASYEEFLVPAMFAPLAELVIERAGVKRGSTVLDVACGTGAASRTAARRAGASGSVTGVDLGEPTLAIARSTAAEEGAAPIVYLQSDAGALPLDAGLFDVALCQQGLQFFPDRAQALAEMRRVLKPGGRLAIATWKDIERSPFIAIADALALHLGPEAAQMMHSPFALGDGTELAGLLSAAGFREITVAEQTLQCTWPSHAQFARRVIAAGPIAPVFDKAPPEAQRAVADAVAERLAPYATADGCLRMEMASNLALARA
jgi:ubiquinone/menaquinone biosynthesis C-methylase UbiE